MKASFVWRLWSNFVLGIIITRLPTSWQSSWSSAWLSTRASPGTICLGTWTRSLFRTNDATFPAGTALGSVLTRRFELCRFKQRLVVGRDGTNWNFAWVNQTQTFLFLPDRFHFLIVVVQKLFHVYFLILMDVFPVLDALGGPNLLLLQSDLFLKFVVDIHCIVCNHRAWLTTSSISAIVVIGLGDQVWNRELLCD